MNKYAQILMSRWCGSTSFVAPDYSKTPGLINPDEMDVSYPVNEITKNRDASIVRAMDARTPPLVRQQLMASIETLPADKNVSRLSDDDKLSIMKSRYCQSRPEIADYNEYLANLVDDSRVSATPADSTTSTELVPPVEPAVSVQPKTD